MRTAAHACGDVLIELRFQKRFDAVSSAVGRLPSVRGFAKGSQRDQSPTEFEFQVAGNVIFGLLYPVIDRVGSAGRLDLGFQSKSRFVFLKGRWWMAPGLA